MNYTNLDISNSIKSYDIKKFIIKIFILIIFIIIISSIIFIYVSNNKDISNTRRKLVKIEDDITILYNYTETMSDFIVGDYILPEENNNNLRNSFNEFKNETLRIIENNKKRT